MIPAWVGITLFAALTQALRFMLQKQLVNAGLSATATTFARFVFAAPIVVLIAWGYAMWTGQGPPGFSPAFWGYVVAGGVSQILATICVVAIFAYRNFAVGITLKKTEVLQSVLVGFLILGDTVSLLGLFAILVGICGVLLLADPPEADGPWRQRILNRAVALGLLSGFFFGLSGVSYRGASLSLADGDTFYRASTAMAFVVVFQLISLAAWLHLREAGQIVAVFRAWRTVALVGLTSMIGTLCWFSAFTLQSAGYVNAVGQVELLFSIAIGALVFGETVTKREWQGMALLSLSIIVLVLVV
ncbi:MAG: DMT family transporter [Pseudomonadota bacterium]